MPLWKDGRFAEDAWMLVADGDDIPADAPAIVPLARWRAERDALSARNAPLGLLIPPGDDWQDIVPDLGRFQVIAVSIPKYGDGRAFSIARLLRERDGYAGEIRAVGIYIVDQMPLMRRVGIDAFQIEDEVTRRALERGVWPEVPEYLQPIDGGREVPAGTRPWARRPRPEPEG
jgi:phosphoadenosine phosphosulfate reductase